MHATIFLNLLIDLSSSLIIAVLTTLSVSYQQSCNPADGVSKDNNTVHATKKALSSLGPSHIHTAAAFAYLSHYKSKTDRNDWRMHT